MPKSNLFAGCYFYKMKHLILLHGAIGSKEQFTQLEGSLNEKFHVHSINFNGHGGDPFRNDVFSIALFADEVLAYMNKQNIATANFFGYSMGGYVAMYLAKHEPAKVERVVTLATKFHWDETTAAKEVKMLDAETIQQKAPSFAAQLKQRHAPNDWVEVLSRTKQMLLQLGQTNALQLGDHATITTPSLLLLGDRDKMVTTEETIAVYKALPNAQFGILPGTPHPIEQTDTELLSMFITRFLS